MSGIAGLSFTCLNVFFTLLLPNWRLILPLFFLKVSSRGNSSLDWVLMASLTDGDVVAGFSDRVLMRFSAWMVSGEP
ncbi:hypothetical protein LINPERPRIM_LOCUS32101 [Linum perenne]